MRRYFLIFDLGGLGFTVEREKNQVGLILSIFWFSLFKKEGRKKKRFKLQEIKVWKLSQAMLVYGLLGKT